MIRPWITPQDIREYTSSENVKERNDDKLAFDIARAERYVIYATNNKFDAEEYETAIPSDVRMAVIMLAEAYAKQAISQKEGFKKSETFDDYSYTAETDSSVADHLGLAAMLSDYILEKSKGNVTMKLRRL